MNDDELPALYRSANELSINSQQEFLLFLKINLTTLVLAAALNVFNLSYWQFSAAQLVALLASLGSSIYLFSRRPDRIWYAGRAVAESIKTMAWRYACRAEPFLVEDELAKAEFRNRLRYVVEQNKDIVRLLTTHLDKSQITGKMNDIRLSSLDYRKDIYRKNRIIDQLSWYASKSAFNRKMSNTFFCVLISVNIIAVVCSMLRITFFNMPFWPTDVFVAMAASILSWMQAKRYSELASSYALAAHEIGLIREQSEGPATEVEFSQFVGDAENAFSREHTQWVARQDA